MVGRNDPCPCGSGKKYKKCCGKEQVVDLQEIISLELEKIMEGFSEEGLESANYFEVEQRTHHWQKALTEVFDKDMIEATAYESYIFHDRVDIWRKYIARQKKHQKRQRIIDILTSWEEPFYLLAEIQKVEGENFVIRDVLTSDTYQFPGSTQGQLGDWLFGLVIRNPLDIEKELQPTSGILFIPSHQTAVVESIKSKLENGVHDSLELYKVFAEQAQLPELPAFGADVLALVESFLKRHQLKNELPRNMAYSFLTEVPLNARKPEGVAAGILQAINIFGFFGNLYVTQKTLAEYFDTSVASLTKYRDLMENYLMERIKERPEYMKNPDSDPSFDPDMDFDLDMSMPQMLTTMGTDPRITESGMWQMVMRTQHSGAESEIDLNQIIQQSMNSTYTPADDAEAAQLMSYQAYDALTEKERRKLAKQAFKLDSENTDANLLMAEITPDPAEKQKYYLKAIQSGQQKSELEPDADITWDFVLHRPLLRALFAYGAWLMEQKKYAESIQPLETLLELNPSDQQGARWLLASAYIRAGKWVEAEDFMIEFPPEEYGAIDFYFDSIMDMHDGTLEGSELKELNMEAVIWNTDVLDLIKDGKNPGEFPRSLSLEGGNEDEAKLIYWLIYGMPGIKNFV
ncbi:hypothetical protein A1A1_13442 [Planococcus antarcticus DSM 14505]|uniref:Preprotein translocase subunit SecA n=1 Tax=Planococcus antarcticus DSM 14505 TaxID=1185653 RepID=A0AA87LR75_9BACL|nr:SEC-C metal-binding domain-containing protein [Planococcus antarcticus]EIM05951.1 hypothetical protein A1A1_13442 [Planococcus antarcticus DSM 14505]